MEGGGPPAVNVPPINMWRAQKKTLGQHLQLQVVFLPTKYVSPLPEVLPPLPAEPPQASAVRSIPAGRRERPVGENLRESTPEKQLEASPGLSHLRVRLHGKDEGKSGVAILIDFNFIHIHSQPTNNSRHFLTNNVRSVLILRLPGLY